MELMDWVISTTSIVVNLTIFLPFLSNQQLMQFNSVSYCLYQYVQPLLWLSYNDDHLMAKYSDSLTRMVEIAVSP